MKELSEAPLIQEFLLERGLDPDHASACGVKALDSTRIAYPLWNGQWKFRDVRTKDMGVIKMGSQDKPLPAVFGWMHQAMAAGPHDFHVHLCEGETDALSLSQVLRDNFLPGVAVAVPGVNGITHAVRLLKPMMGNNLHITIYPDGDDAGLSLASAASELGAYVIKLPPGHDLCSFLKKIEQHNRWPALQLLRHHAATYVPFDGAEKQRKRTEPSKASDVPPGVVSYFQRIVGEVLGDEAFGYSEVEKVCCPWHADPNPSLSIDWSRCIFYCHGCGIGGGVKKWRELAQEGRHL